MRFTPSLLIFGAFLINILAAAESDFNTYFQGECEDTYCSPPPCQLKNTFCGVDVLFSAEYLYWQIRSDELPYALNVDTSEVDLQATTVERIKPDAESGLRIGLSTQLPNCESCSLSAAWTHLSGSSNASATEESFLLPIWLSPVGNPIADTADAEYKINLNIADISLVRSDCLWDKTTLHTSVGVRGVWLGQDLDVSYLGGNISAGLDAKNSIDFCGWGLRAGALTKCEICYGFSFVGWSYVDLLWTKIDVLQQTVRPTNNQVRDSIKDSLHTITPMFELFLGLSWSCKLSCADVTTRIGWEQQYFVNGIQFNQYSSRNDDDVSVHQNGGLGLGGLTVGLAVGF